MEKLSVIILNFNNAVKMWVLGPQQSYGLHTSKVVRKRTVLRGREKENVRRIKGQKKRDIVM